MKSTMEQREQANQTGERCRGTWPWGRADAGATVKRWERGVIVSSISEDECWQIQETLKARYRRRTAVRGGRGLPEPDKTFIFELLLVRVLCVISHSRIPLHPWGGKQNSNQATSRTPPFPLPSQGLVLSSHLPRIRGCTLLWLKSTHPSLPPGSGLTSPTTDYFEPFSGYIIASLSSSLYSPYRCSISAKPHIESCNYPDCHLIAGLFISSITAGPANSSWGQRERKGLLVAQCATDSSSLWYIYSSSWVQSKLMHRGNSFFSSPPFPFNPTKTALSQSFPSLSLWMCKLNWSWANNMWSNLLEPMAAQYTHYLGFHGTLPSFRGMWNNSNTDFFIFNTVHNSKCMCKKLTY